MRLFWAIFLLPHFLSCQEEPNGPELGHVRVIWDSNPAHEAIISWTTNKLGKNSFATLVATGTNRQLIFPAKKEGVFEGSRLFKSNLNSYYHHSKTSDLLPNKIYQFWVQTDQKKSETYTFKTAPLEGSWSALFGGDSRSDQRQRQGMNRLIHKLAQEDSSLLALIHGGDYIDNGNDWNQWNTWLNDHSAPYKKNDRILPIVPNRGNHEVNRNLFNQVWGFPGEGEGYYKIDLPNTQLTILNTEESMTGNQLEWLKTNLRTEKNWSIASYHRPAYPAVKSPSAALGYWVPHFEKQGVDIVFESDGHAYKRTAPILAGKINERSGIVYLGEGGLGVKQRNPASHRWYFQGGHTEKTHHIIRLDVTAHSLITTAIDNLGKNFDNFELQAKKF